MLDGICVVQHTKIMLYEHNNILAVAMSDWNANLEQMKINHQIFHINVVLFNFNMAKRSIHW